MQNREEKVEVLLFIIAFGIAVFLRFLHLGVNALGDGEAPLLTGSSFGTRRNRCDFRSTWLCGSNHNSFLSF
jgi:hypothetical protein